MGVSEIVFLQDARRARVYDNYTKNLKKKLRQNKNLDFLKNFDPVLDTFVHSGLTCRKSKMDKIIDVNSIKRVK